MTTQANTGKLILRKERFGGILADPSAARLVFLRPAEYETNRQELLSASRRGANVKFFDARELGYPLLRSAASSPLDLFLELTKKCNGACVHCYMDSNPPRSGESEMSFAEIEPVIRQFSDMGGQYVRLTGGEPTVREDFLDIVELIHSKGIGVGINTNGLLQDRCLDRVFALGVKDIRVSLDGPEAVNDSIRGKGSFQRTVRTLGSIAARNKEGVQTARLTINFVLMKSNSHTMEEMIDFAQEFDAVISFGLLRPTGRASIDEMLSPDEVVDAAFRVQKARSTLGLGKGKVRINYDIFCDSAEPVEGFAPYPFDNSKCQIGTRGLSVDAFGRVAPCGYLVGVQRWVGEDVRGRDLLEVWHTSPVLQQSRMVTRPGCKGCKYHITRCNGGCPAAAFVCENDLDGRDPYCVRSVDIGEVGR